MPRNYKAKNKHLKDPNTYKEGRFSNDEKLYIAENYENLTIEEMAQHLHRSVNTVKSYVQKIIADTISQGEQSKLTIKYDLKSFPFFNDLVEQYSKRELQTIEYHWNYLISQFKEDVLHTERMQILQYGETMVDISRIKKLEKVSEEQLIKLQSQLEDLYQAVPKKEDRDQIWRAKERAIDEQIADLRNSRKSVTEEKAKLVKQSQDLLTSLNATRGQRVKIATDHQLDITSLLKSLANEQLRRQFERENKLMQLSADKERTRLSSEYKYMDGVYDRPILNSETVFYEEELPIEGDYI